MSKAGGKKSGAVQKETALTGAGETVAGAEIAELPANFLQSEAWARANELVGHKVLRERFGGRENFLIVKAAKRGRYLEIPGGPVIDWADGELVQKTFAQIRELAARENCAFVRLRPQLLKDARNLEILAGAGAVPAPMHLHAEHTVVIDLTLPEEELLSNMRRQTRYEVRRAAKLGIEVMHDNSAETFREFHKVQLETARRQNFIPPSLEVLMAEREAFGANATIYCAMAPGAPIDDAKPATASDTSFRAPVAQPAVAGVLPIVFSRKKIDPSIDVSEAVASNIEHDASGAVAFGLILRDGDEAAYFEAASTELNRKLPGAYALQWQAMRDLKAAGVKRYNLWGIAPPGAKNHRYSGVTTFKTGFGGEVVEFVPAHDIVIKRKRYALDLIIEKARKKRRNL